MATRTAHSVASSPLSNSSPAATEPLALAPLGLPRLRLAAARTGDHPLIHAFLLSVFHGPTAAEFHAQLEEPGYLPSSRLIVKHGEEIAAHLRLARQTIHLGDRTLPAARFMDLGTAPELRCRGVATALVAAGQRAAADRGVLVALTRTSAPAIFARHGWTVCGRHCYSTAAPRAVLAELASDAAAAVSEAMFPPVETRPLIVRPLRRVELPAVMRLYADRSRQHAGWPVRSEAYWDWLLARGACDRVYVASTAAESPSMEALLATIVGYAFVRQSRIVEMVTAPSREDAARSLLERIGADGREQDDWTVRYDSPADDPLHSLLCRAGGHLTRAEESGGEWFMAKVLDPLAALRKLAPLLLARAEAAGIALPCELGLELRARADRSRATGIVERLRIKLTQGEAAIETGGPSRHSIAIGMHDLTPLVLGYTGPANLAAVNHLVSSTAKALNLATALFPASLWSRPVLDDLLA
jgi:predicted acetyltransferase